METEKVELLTDESVRHLRIKAEGSTEGWRSLAGMLMRDREVLMRERPALLAVVEAVANDLEWMTHGDDGGHRRSAANLRDCAARLRALSSLAPAAPAAPASQPGAAREATAEAPATAMRAKWVSEQFFGKGSDGTAEELEAFVAWVVGGAVQAAEARKDAEWREQTRSYLDRIELGNTQLESAEAEVERLKAAAAGKAGEGRRRIEVTGHQWMCEGWFHGWGGLSGHPVAIIEADDGTMMFKSSHGTNIKFLAAREAGR